MSVPCVNDQRLRLLLLTDTSILSSGGSERFLRNLAARLPAAHYKITVVQLTQTTKAWTDIGLPDNIQHVKMRSFPMGAAYGFGGLRALRKLRQLVQRERFDVVQSQHEKSDLFNALLPRMGSAVHISNRRDMGFNKSGKLRLLFRFLNHRFDCVVAPAQPILSGLARQERLAPRRMLWIPNGVDTTRFQPLSIDARQQLRQRLGFGEDNILFGCVASLSDVKRHVDLVAAFARTLEHAPDARLLLIGDGPLRKPLERQMAELGVGDKIQLLGNQPHVETLLPALDVAVLASSTEGMSNAVLEAMACGLPVVATAVGGNLQLVQHDINGLLVPPFDPVALSTALQALADDPTRRLRMGAAARSRIERDFSLDGMVNSFDRLYRRLLDRA